MHRLLLSVNSIFLIPHPNKHDLVARSFFFLIEPLISYVGTKNWSHFSLAVFIWKDPNQNGADTFVNTSQGRMELITTPLKLYCFTLSHMFKTTFVEKSQKRNYFKNQRFGFYNSTYNENTCAS